MACHRLRVACAFALLAATAVSLAACGRNGPPDLPPGPAITPAPTAAAPPATPSATAGGPVAPGVTEQQTAIKNGFDAEGNPVAPPGDKKSFFLDFLLQ